ncbi:MAG: SAF domain-containing protein [Beijerinckiaceae bacterium]|nr:SAF domain-containing protein [Beijerinckiaceae bacterium]MCZ8300088.1 SAF domain-containing protein [Beijerinckiaceae bacterium]
MNHHHRFAALADPVSLCVIGSGQFGQSLIAQARHIPRLSPRIAVDLTAEAAGRAFVAAGHDPQDVALCMTAREARAAHQAGRLVAAGSLDSVIDLPFDILIEATGHPEAAARHSLSAIEAKRHVLLVSKEADSVAGPILARKAREKGVRLAPVDGDQPSLLIDLVTWAEILGFEILCAGKSSEYDFVVDPASDDVTCNGVPARIEGIGAIWNDPALPISERAAGRASLLGWHFPLRAVPDLCEMTLVANATGLVADRPGFHCPVARIPEIAELLRPQDMGGLLGGGRRLDVFHHIRMVDEASFAGGVFVCVRCQDRTAWQVLSEKGHAVSRDGQTAMIYLPRHLLGLEAATSLFDLAAFGETPYGPDYAPKQDLVAVTTRPLMAGTVLEARGHHHTIDGVTAEMRPALPLSAEATTPYYLVANRILARDLPTGAAIRPSDLVIEAKSTLLDLRLQQDAAFLGA